MSNRDSQSHLWGALSYLSILSLIMLLTKKDDDFVVFHARQGFVLFIISLLGVVPGVGWIAFLGAVALSIVGMVKAAQGDKYEIPLIGKVAGRVKIG